MTTNTENTPRLAPLGRLGYLGGEILLLVMVAAAIVLSKEANSSSIFFIALPVWVAGSYYLAIRRETDIVNARADLSKSPFRWRVKTFFSLFVMMVIGSFFVMVATNDKHLVEGYRALIQLAQMVPLLSLTFHRGKLYEDAQARKVDARLLRAEAKVA